MRLLGSRLLAMTIATVMILALLAGCKSDGQKGNTNSSIHGNNDLSEYTYTAEVVPFPNEVSDISCLTYYNEKVFFVSTIYDAGNEENFFSKTNSSSIYSMNIDGTNLTRLNGYMPPAAIPDDSYGGVGINKMNIDDGGNIWVVERWDFYSYDLPADFDREGINVYEHQLDRGSGSAIRKLDATGVELFSIDIDNLKGLDDSLFVDQFATDSMGNCYIGINNYDIGGMSVYVFDSNGKEQFQLDIDSRVDRIIRIESGFVALATESTDENGNTFYTLQTINDNSEIMGNSLILPETVDGRIIQSNSGDFHVLMNNTSSLYGLASEGYMSKLFDWSELNIIPDSIQDIMMIPDGRIIFVYNSYDRMANSQSYELFVLLKTARSEIPQITTLTLATFWGGSALMNAVEKFNRTNNGYRIQIVDYSDFCTEDDPYAGLLRLSTELISGNAPDILDVTNIAFKEYVARGLLTDLYPFIDSDPQYSRDSIVDGVLKASETDGQLYHIFPMFYVNCIIGHPSVLGFDMGWNMEEFKAVLTEHHDADIPMGQWMTKMTYLEATVAFDIDELIDWGGGVTRFNDPGFIQLLEYCGTLPDKIEDQEITNSEAIAAGRQIMLQTGFGDFAYLPWYKAIFGGQLVFKGFPTESESGISLTVDMDLAITEFSENKDGAWAFIRMVLDEGWQLSNNWCLPTNAAAFDSKIKDALDGNFNITFFGGPEVLPLSQTDIDQVAVLISSASGTSGWNIDPSIWNIISESASDYFNGACSVEDAARIIQSRVSILVSERS